MYTLKFLLWRIKFAFLLRRMARRQRVEAKQRIALELTRKHSSVFMVGEPRKPNIPYTFHKES